MLALVFFEVDVVIVFFLVLADATYGFPRFEHGMQTLNIVPSIKTVFFPSVIGRPHSSQNNDIESMLINVNLAFSKVYLIT
jgi:hypothetical protein